MRKRFLSVSFLRNFIFGVEDSLVSTVGLLSGIAIAGVPRETIILTGIVLIFVEAFSMSAGSFLSEASAESYEKGTEQASKKSFRAGVVMFCSYLVSGFIPLSAYIFWPVETALTISISFSVVALFILGIVAAKISGIHLLKSGVRMALVGGVAILVGTLAGALIPAFN